VTKTLIILKHEFIQTIKRRSFIILTLAFPLIGLLGISGYQLIQGTDRPPTPEEALNVGYIDQVGIFNDYTEQHLVNLIPFDTTDEATKALLADELDEYIVISSDYIDTGSVKRYTTEREIEPPGEIWPAIRNFLLGNLLDEQLTEEELTRAQHPLNLSSVTLDETGQVSEEQGGIGVFIVPYIFGLLLIMAIFTSSGFLLQGLGEEKENRIMEILLSSVSARQLITGKVLGLGAAGLLQILVWVVSAQVLVVFGSSAIGGFFDEIQIPDGFFLLAPIYFILGYLLFAVLMAGIGAITNTSREGQQMSAIFTIPAVLPFILQVFLIENPTHIVSQLLTFFPLTAPIAVIIRLGSTNIPVWELMLSVSFMVAAIIGAIWLSAKVFRTFLLMYGKTPKLGEILRSLRQA
jgi:ABC-2 type transport system permease protein